MHNGNQLKGRLRTSASGFTLIELLITITIIAVLVALALFGYMKFRDAGDKVVVVNNLRQLQAANAGYAADHNGYFVSTFSSDDKGQGTNPWWANDEFLTNLRGASGEKADGSGPSTAIPESLLDPVALKSGGRNSKRIVGSYGMIPAIPGDYRQINGNSRIKLAQVESPGRSAAFATALDWRITYGARFRWSGDEDRTGQGILAYRHNDKAFVTYYDGHVGSVSKADVEKFDEEGERQGENHPFWNPWNEGRRPGS